LLFNRI